MGTPLTTTCLTMLRTLALTLMTLTLVLTPPSLASMNKVAPGLWVGNQHAAGDLATLAKEGITAVLNVAWDLDIAYPSSAYTGNMEDFNEHLDNLQYAKVGLVDGDGNPPGSLAAAVLALSTFLNPREGLDDKDKTTFPQPVNAVLLHCHSGQSRSVTVAALYLTLTGSYSTYKTALAHVKAARGLTDNHAVPVHALTALAHKLVNKGFSLNVIPDDSSSSSTTSATSGGTTTTATSASGGPSSSTTASSGTTAATTSTSGSGGGSTADASPAAPAGSSKKSSKASVALAIVFSIISVMVIAFLIAFALSKRFPDSRFSSAISSLSCPCRRSSSLSSAYSMSAAPDYDF